MKKTSTWLRTRRLTSLALFLIAFCCIGLIFSGTSLSQANSGKKAAPEQQKPKLPRNPLISRHSALQSAATSKQ
jgi:hypothetical protein